MPRFLIFVVLLGFLARCSVPSTPLEVDAKPRIIVTSDGEIDDECSMVRFLLYTNEWDVEGIITSSSQYHWHGHNWAGDDWLDPYLEAYTAVYPNLILHDGEYPSPEYLKSIAFLGNVEAEGEMDSITAGSQHMVKVLLDSTDNTPIWIHAWGGTNTIARALKTIEEDHPEKMEEVANKIRFFFIWEQDSTYQSYIRPNWGKYNILTIISDQFLAIAYQWNKILPEDKQAYFKGDWMSANILNDHGPLGALYKAHVPGSHGLSGDTLFNVGDFRSEGDSPAFLHNINNGLGNMESPDFGGWGGRYVHVRENTWLDPVPVPGYEYPEGRWYTGSAWGRNYMRAVYPENQDQMNAYFRPLARWTDALQNDFAARSDWCVKPFEKANHPPQPVLNGDRSLKAIEISARPGQRMELDASGSTDIDKDGLTFEWRFYSEAGTYPGEIKIDNPNRKTTSLIIPEDASGKTLHVLLVLTDDGEPSLTRYRRLVINCE